MRSIRRAAGAVLLVAVAALATACGHAAQATPEPQVTVTETAEPAPQPQPRPTVTGDPLTMLAVEIAWRSQTNSDKQTMCEGIAIFGKSFAAGALRQGLEQSDGDSDIDADLAASLLEQRCDEEGY